MDRVELTSVIEALLSGDRARQRKAVDDHIADDVRFSHIMGTVKGKEAFYGIYRLAATAWRYKVLLRFAEDKSGKLRVTEQVDHHSMLAVLWLLGWPFTSISEMIIRPFSGFVLSRLGWALDAVSGPLEWANIALANATAALLSASSSLLDTDGGRARVPAAEVASELREVADKQCSKVA